MIEIKDRWTDKVLITINAATMREALEQACRDGANLDGANLSRANLDGAHLDGANLSRANLSRANLSRAHLDGANLSRANLDGANLSRAHLDGANLYGANLDGALKPETRIETGETWSEYLTLVVPALLTAGDKTIKEIVEGGAWKCHSWDNCPMAEAFSVHKTTDAPILLRPRIDQFIRYFDAGLIPPPAVDGDAPKEAA